MRRFVTQKYHLIWNLKHKRTFHYGQRNCQIQYLLFIIPIYLNGQLNIQSFFLYFLKIIPTTGVITNFVRFFFNFNTFSFAQSTLLGLQKSQIYLVFMGWWIEQQYSKKVTWFLYSDTIYILKPIIMFSSFNLMYPTFCSFDSKNPYNKNICKTKI